MKFRFYTTVLAGIFILLFSCKSQNYKTKSGFGGGWGKGNAECAATRSKEKFVMFGNAGCDTISNLPSVKIIQKTNLSNVREKILAYKSFTYTKNSLIKPAQDSAKKHVPPPLEKNSIRALNLIFGSMAGLTFALTTFILEIYPFEFSALISVLSLVTMLIGITFAVLALIKIQKNPSKYRGKGRAILALILPTIFIIAFTSILSLLFRIY